MRFDFEKKGRVLVAGYVLWMAQAVMADTLVLESGGDAVRGKEVYAQCAGCHSPDRHRTGPKHCGLIGRQAGSADGFDYSQAMRVSRVIWNAQTLDRFLSAPLSFMPGTKMAIAGVRHSSERSDLIAYLITMNEQPVCE